MIDQQIEIPTRDGRITTFITDPECGGPFPVIIFYMDAPAIREELRDMARRLATSGYYVMLPNLHYCAGVMELGPLPADPESPERKRMFGYMISINIPLVMEDTKALLAYAEGHGKTKAELYFGCAETDIYAPQEIINKVKEGMKGSNNEVEIYPGTHHGFAFPKRPVYDRDAAERHWERLLALYRRNLAT